MKATAETTAEIKTHVTQAVQLLRQLRDEVRVEMHLAGMEAKDQWNALEPKLAIAEQAGHVMTEATKQLLHDTVEELKGFKAVLLQESKAKKLKS